MPSGTIDEIRVRAMRQAELGLSLDWAAQEGWNPGLNDARSFWAADRRGFFLAEVDGEPGGSICAVAYDASFGFCGLYLVRRDLRGQGVGQRLWEAGMSHLGQRSIGLDGVPTQQTNYERSGFRRAHSNSRYRGEGLTSGAGKPLTEALADVPFDDVAAYDRAVFGASREGFLRDWVNQPSAVAFATVEDGRVTGYGLCRPCREGFKVGPLFADHAHGAEALLDDLIAAVQGAALYIDVPETNSDGVGLVERRGLVPVFSTARMYRGPAAPLDTTRVFGITSLELG
jgi:GNAT superfamily N-acetyltransferase